MSAMPSGSISYLTPNNGEVVAKGSVAFQNNLLGLGRVFDPSFTADLVRDADGAVVSQRQSGAKRYYLHDHIGSTRGLLDSAGGGTIARSYTYDPDGKPTGSGSGMTAVVDFAGGHGLAGLYHFGARWYEPETGRWTQPDPLYQPTDLRQGNRYTYVGGNPVNGVDPSGLRCYGANIKAGVGVSASYCTEKGSVEVGVGYGVGIYVTDQEETDYSHTTTACVAWHCEGEADYGRKYLDTDGFGLGIGVDWSFEIDF
jgi:RHS repeat-associated protein